MRVVPNHFDDIHFTESILGKPTVHGGSLRVPVKGLALVGNHPLSGTHGLAGSLVFTQVVDSRRLVSEYVGDPKNPEGFKPERIEIDGPFPPGSPPNVREFIFEGFLEGPPAWIGEWRVRASTFQLELSA
jgi:hypothetical protein